MVERGAKIRNEVEKDKCGSVISKMTTTKIKRLIKSKNKVKRIGEKREI